MLTNILQLTYLFLYIGSEDNSRSTVNGLLEYQSSILGRDKKFSLHQNIQPDSEIHSALYTLTKELFSDTSKAAGT
jgi:hypothetical protein